MYAKSRYRDLAGTGCVERLAASISRLVSAASTIADLNHSPMWGDILEIPHSVMRLQRARQCALAGIEAARIGAFSLETFSNVDTIPPLEMLQSVMSTLRGLQSFDDSHSEYSTTEPVELLGHKPDTPLAQFTVPPSTWAMLSPPTGRTSAETPVPASASEASDDHEQEPLAVPGDGRDNPMFQTPLHPAAWRNLPPLVNFLDASVQPPAEDCAGILLSDIDRVLDAAEAWAAACQDAVSMGLKTIAHARKREATMHSHDTVVLQAVRPQLVQHIKRQHQHKVADAQQRQRTDSMSTTGSISPSHAPRRTRSNGHATQDTAPRSCRQSLNSAITAVGAGAAGTANRPRTISALKSLAPGSYGYFPPPKPTTPTDTVTQEEQTSASADPPVPQPAAPYARVRASRRPSTDSLAARKQDKESIPGDGQEPERYDVAKATLPPKPSLTQAAVAHRSPPGSATDTAQPVEKGDTHSPHDTAPSPESPFPSAAPQDGAQGAPDSDVKRAALALQEQGFTEDEIALLLDGLRGAGFAISPMKTEPRPVQRDLTVWNEPDTAWNGQLRSPEEAIRHSNGSAEAGPPTVGSTLSGANESAGTSAVASVTRSRPSSPHGSHVSASPTDKGELNITQLAQTITRMSTHTLKQLASSPEAAAQFAERLELAARPISPQGAGLASPFMPGEDGWGDDDFDFHRDVATPTLVAALENLPLSELNDVAKSLRSTPRRELSGRGTARRQLSALPQPTAASGRHHTADPSTLDVTRHHELDKSGPAALQQLLSRHASAQSSSSDNQPTPIFVRTSPSAASHSFTASTATGRPLLYSPQSGRPYASNLTQRLRQLRDSKVRNGPTRNAAQRRATSTSRIPRTRPGADRFTGARGNHRSPNGRGPATKLSARSGRGTGAAQNGAKQSTDRPGKRSASVGHTRRRPQSQQGRDEANMQEPTSSSRRGQPNTEDTKPESSTLSPSHPLSASASARRRDLLNGVARSRTARREKSFRRMQSHPSMQRLQQRQPPPPPLSPASPDKAQTPRVTSPLSRATSPSGQASKQAKERTSRLLQSTVSSRLKRVPRPDAVGGAQTSQGPHYDAGDDDDVSDTGSVERLDSGDDVEQALQLGPRSPMYSSRSPQAHQLPSAAFVPRSIPSPDPKHDGRLGQSALEAKLQQVRASSPASLQEVPRQRGRTADRPPSPAQPPAPSPESPPRSPPILRPQLRPSVGAGAPPGVRPALSPQSKHAPPPPPAQRRPQTTLATRPGPPKAPPRKSARSSGSGRPVIDTSAPPRAAAAAQQRPVAAVSADPSTEEEETEDTMFVTFGGIRYKLTPSGRMTRNMKQPQQQQQPALHHHEPTRDLIAPNGRQPASSTQRPAVDSNAPPTLQEAGNEPGRSQPADPPSASARSSDPDGAAETRFSPNIRLRVKLTSPERIAAVERARQRATAVMRRARATINKSTAYHSPTRRERPDEANGGQPYTAGSSQPTHSSTSPNKVASNGYTNGAAASDEKPWLVHRPGSTAFVSPSRPNGYNQAPTSSHPQKPVDDEPRDRSPRSGRVVPHARLQHMSGRARVVQPVT